MLSSADLDALCAAGEVVWRGIEALGDRDGRVALYLTDHFPRLYRPGLVNELTGREEALLTHLRTHGASFFGALHEAAGGGYPGETVDTLWDLVWKGAITNDTFHALRAFTRPPERRSRKPPRTRAFRSRRMAPPSAEGRWSLIADRITSVPTDTQWSTAMAQQLLSRYGLVTREVAAFEGIVGGFGAVYDVLKALEDAGRVRRGYFVAGVGATQFALPPALDLLRSLREASDDVETLVLAATDPANPYGVTLKWPEGTEGDQTAGRGPTRTVGSMVVLVNGALGAYIPRGGRQIAVWLPDEEPARSSIGRGIAHALSELARDEARGGLLVGEINGQPPGEHGLTPFLIDAGFYPSAMGLQMRRAPTALVPAGVEPARAQREA